MHEITNVLCMAYMNMLYARILHREKDDIDDVCFDDGKKRKENRKMVRH